MGNEGEGQSSRHMQRHIQVCILYNPDSILAYKLHSGLYVVQMTTLMIGPSFGSVVIVVVVEYKT